MINLTQPSGSNWPSNFILSPHLSNGLPALAQAFDHHRIAPTSAVGTSLEAICGATGEFMERRHFYNEVIPEKELILSEMMGTEATYSYIKAITQTANKELIPPEFIE